MKAWILSICGVVFLGVMIDVISPNGKMNTFIKSIFSLIFIFVLVTPIVNYINGKHNYQVNINLVQDDELINVVTEQKIKVLEQSIVKVLIEKGFNDINVEISAKMENNELIVSNIVVLGANKVLLDTSNSINYVNEITEIVSSIAGVSKEVIVFG